MEELRAQLSGINGATQQIVEQMSKGWMGEFAGMARTTDPDGHGRSRHQVGTDRPVI